MSLLWSIIACLSPQEEILMVAFKECHSVLMQCNNQPFHREATDYYMCKHIIHVHPYKVSQEPVSIHLPVSRLLAGRIIYFRHLYILLVFFFSSELTLLCILIPRSVCTNVQSRGS